MRARTVIAAIALAAMATSALGQTLPPTVSVTGEASISVPPDLAQIDSGEVKCIPWEEARDRLREKYGAQG